MSFISKDFEQALKSVMEGYDPLDSMSIEELEALAESFEDRLEKIRAKIAKKPKDEYDFEPEKPRSAKTKVQGSYGKSHTEVEDDAEKKVKAPESAIKRGRGRPRKNP